MPLFPEDGRCYKEYEAISDPIYILTVPGVQFLASISSFILIVTFLLRFMGRGYFHRNAKILIFWQLVCYLVMTCIFIGTNFDHLYHFFVSRESPCSFFNEAQDCTYVYHTYVLVLGGSAMIQVSIGLERFVCSLYSKHYETFSITLSVTLVMVTLILAILLQFFVLYGTDPEEFRLGCGGLPLSGGANTTSLYIMILVCNGSSLGLFLLAWIIGAKKAEHNGRYELNASYQKVEHYRLLKMFSPNVIIQTLIYAFYCASTMLARGMYSPNEKASVQKTIFMRHNALPYCATIELILMHYILTKVHDGRRKFKAKISQVENRGSGDAYFQSLAQQWNKI